MTTDNIDHNARYAEVEERQERILKMLSRLTSDEDDIEGRDPPIHLIAQDGKLRLCLSQIAKVVGSAIVALTLTGATATITFAWQSNRSLGEILQKLEDMNERLDRYYHRLERVEDKIDGKMDKAGGR